MPLLVQPRYCTINKVRVVPAILRYLSVIVFLSACASSSPPDPTITNSLFDLYGKTLEAMDNASTDSYAKSKRAAFYAQTYHALDVLKLRAEIAATPNDKTVVDGISRLEHQYTLLQSNDKSGWARDTRDREESIQNNLAGIRQQVENIAYENAGKKAAAAISRPPSAAD
jgi:hypothetical protein